MDMAANYAPQKTTSRRSPTCKPPTVFRSPIEVETEGTQSWLSAFRHPLVVGGVLAVLSGVLASLVIPGLTRVWQDRPNELALKEAIVERISQRATATISKGASFGSSSLEKIRHDDRIALLNDAQQTWDIDSAGVASQLNTYFRRSDAITQWPAFEDAVRQFLQYAAAIAPDAQPDQLVGLAENFKKTTFSDPAAEELRKGFLSAPRVFPYTVEALLDNWKDELTTLVLDSNASGFSHGFWFLH
jgi:hypothetical protein